MPPSKEGSASEKSAKSPTIISPKKKLQSKQRSQFVRDGNFLRTQSSDPYHQQLEPPDLRDLKKMASGDTFHDVMKRNQSYQPQFEEQDSFFIIEPIKTTKK